MSSSSTNENRLQPIKKPVEEYIAIMENNNTKAKTTNARDVNLLKVIYESRSPEEIEPQTLKNYLSQFVICVRGKEKRSLNQ